MFYDKYVKLCNSVGKTPSAVALEIGIEKSTVTRWKSGKSQTDKNIQKVADFFGVSVEWLKNDDDDSEPDIKKPTAMDGELSKDIQELKTLLEGMSDEKLQMIVNYAKFLASQE